MSPFTLSCAFAALTTLATPVVAQGLARDELEHSSWFCDVSTELRRGEYHFSRVDDGETVWTAPNRSQGFRSRVSSEGLEIVPRETSRASWSLTLSTRSFGRAGEACDLTRARVRVANERAELDHEALAEWFVNDERGLEQGWTIPSAPAGDGGLWIGLEVGGDLDLRIDAGSRSGVFVDASGTARLGYTGLTAFDATGRELDARILPSPDGIGISIDDLGAAYPLTVDPVLTGPAWTAEGNQLGAWFGASVASAGDVNGDGYSDVIVGAPTYDNGEIGEGRAFVYLGAAGGLSSSPAWTAESDQPNAEFGNSVATAGDVDGDGFSDVIVAAWQYDNGETNEGRAFVFLGSSAGLATSAAWTAEGDQLEAAFGMSAATAGDVNGDGFSDVILGAWLYDGGEANEGRAFVYLGSSSGLSAGAAWTAESDQLDARFGISVASAGDIDGDGFDDVIVGADQFDDGEIDEGRAYVYRGSSSGLAASPVWTAEGDQAIAHMGLSVATAGDVNGDGYSDVIVGATFFSGGEVHEGRALVYLGSSTGLAAGAAWTAEGDQDFASFASAVATAGDTNGDGYSDVIVGAQGFNNGELNEGATFVYLGSGDGLSTVAAWTAEGDQLNARFGWSVATAGDVNGDGYSDVIVGANLYENGESSEGRAFLYTGAATGLSIRSFGMPESDQAAALFGYAVSTAGDVNGDGYSDVIVGAPYYDNGQSDEGGAFLYLGSSAGLSEVAVWTAEGNQAGAQLGFSVSTAGDVNGDGYSDAIVGARTYDNPFENEGRAFLYLGTPAGLGATAAWTAESNVAGAEFGSAVATAGDVNGDGRSDVIVGAYRIGRAFVYLGTSTGLTVSAAWTGECNQPDATFGISVASAGDVDADGYSDVIVGAEFYDNGQSSEGRAFVYLGSSTGLSDEPDWTAESDAFFAHFGNSVASAGDVNGDGYSDVIVGALWYSNAEFEEGKAFVYMGSSAGLAASAAWTVESDQADAWLGVSVASAGDVNGDGYSDVIVGSSMFDGGAADSGRAFLYLGSATGLAAESAWTADGDSASLFAAAVASAGDVNGDGFSDVIVGANGHSNGQSQEGRARFYLGNEGRGGWTLTPRQRQASDAAPIDLLGRSANVHEFRIRLDFEHELTGFGFASGLTPKARLEWEVRPLQSPLDGSHQKSGMEQTITGLPLSFNERVETHSAPNPALTVANTSHVPFEARRALHWRARVRTNNPLFPVTPWVTLPGNNVTETKLRAGPLERKR